MKLLYSILAALSISASTHAMQQTLLLPDSNSFEPNYEYEFDNNYFYQMYVMPALATFPAPAHWSKAPVTVPAPIQVPIQAPVPRTMERIITKKQFASLNKQAKQRLAQQEAQERKTVAQAAPHRQA